MKILIISQYFYPENFRVNTLCKELAARGHVVTVLTGYPQYPQGEIYAGYGFKIPYKKEWEGVNIERVKTYPRGKSFIGLLRNCISFVAQANKWVQSCSEKYDAIYVFEVSPITVGLPAVKYKKKFGTPIFFNVQDLWPENVQIVLGIQNRIIINIINKIADTIYKSSDKILCASNGFVNNLKRKGVEQKKLVYWPQFCEDPYLTQHKSPSCYEKAFFNIVFAGNIGEAQGLEMLIDVAEKLSNENIRWYLVGDGRYKSKLVDLVKTRGLEQVVFFVGKVSELEANSYVIYSDCAYLSLKNNALFDMTIPAKLQTYLACGTPVLAATGGECAEIINKNGCGIAIKQSVEDVSGAVLDILNLTEKEKNKMKKNARNYYELHFKKDSLVSQLEKMMENENESFDY